MTHIQLHVTSKPADDGTPGRSHIATSIDNYELDGEYSDINEC